MAREPIIPEGRVAACDHCENPTFTALVVYMREAGRATRYETKETVLCVACRRKLRGKWRHAK